MLEKKKTKTQFHLAPFLDDLLIAFMAKEIFLVLGLQDVVTRYRRSRVGAFWLTINMLVLITVLGTVFGSIFRASVADFLPSLAVGIIVWGLISNTIAEGCESFTASRDTILQVRLPFLTHTFRTLTRNLLVFFHNIIIIPLVFIFFSQGIDFIAILAILGLALVLINLGWIVVVLAIICARFRDMVPIVQNFMQVSFYLTPIIWDGAMLPERVSQYLLNFNPFFHFLSIVREPLLGEFPSFLNWMVCILLALSGWLFAAVVFSRYKNRIAYWL